MAIIGTFTRTEDGKFTGSLKTLTLSSKLQFVPETNKSKDSAPDYRVFFASFEVGAAWQRTARDSGREYWSVRLDDPTFTAPLRQPDRGRGRQDTQPLVVTPHRRLTAGPRRAPPATTGRLGLSFLPGPGSTA
jgi:uncharacterized protein (DUF736 family)